MPVGKAAARHSLIWGAIAYWLLAGACTLAAEDDAVGASHCASNMPLARCFHDARRQLIWRSESYDIRAVTVADGLKDPWSISFLPTGEMLVTERPGRLRIVKEGRLQKEPISGTPDVRYGGHGGLLDVAVHPEFNENHYIYLSYAKPNERRSQATLALSRAQLIDGKLTNLKEIFEAEAWSGATINFGGRIALDGKGHLFLTVGDRGLDPAILSLRDHPAQSLATHMGKILRLHEDGSVPEDNPFAGCADAKPQIWSYGHRNPQGLIVDPATGDLWETEHGPQGGDELNLIRPGRNYGWPVVGYGTGYGGAVLQEANQNQEMVSPIQFWTPSIAPSGLLKYDGARFAKWRGDFFVGGLEGHQIARLHIVDTGLGFQVERLERPPLLAGMGRFRDVRQGPDGLIYVAIDDWTGSETTQILRLEPVE